MRVVTYHDLQMIAKQEENIFMRKTVVVQLDNIIKVVIKAPFDTIEEPTPSLDHLPCVKDPEEHVDEGTTASVPNPIDKKLKEAA